jgi:glucose-6-phosphate 1-dehydrogenase
MTQSAVNHHQFQSKESFRQLHEGIKEHSALLISLTQAPMIFFCVQQCLYRKNILEMTDRVKIVTHFRW